MTSGRPIKATTMADVARVAQVSVPTVSRVLSGTAPVNADKRDRVLKAIEKLRFRPSAAARMLVSGKSNVVAVIAGSTSVYGYAETLRGIEEAARAQGFSVLITVVESGQDEDVDQALSLALAQAIAGVIVLKFDGPGVAVLRKVPPEVPAVAISGLRDSSVSQAVLDDAEAAEELTNYLLDLGHATVHHVRIPPSRREDGRTTGWKQALKKRSAIVPALLDASWEPRSGRLIGRELAARKDVTAVFCGNDEIAMGVIRGLADEGKAVPGDISVVGFDDHPLASLWFPPLTTVHQDFADLGQRGFDLLMRNLREGAHGFFSSRRPTLVIRDSAAAPRL